MAQVQTFELHVDSADATRIDPQTGGVRATGRLTSGVLVLLDGSAIALAAVPPRAPQLDACTVYVGCDAKLRRVVDALVAGAGNGNAGGSTNGGASAHPRLEGHGGVDKTILGGAAVADARMRRDPRHGALSLHVGCR